MSDTQLDDINALLRGMRKHRNQKDAAPIIEAVVKGFEYDPGHSDLDDEQPIHVQMTLGDYRKARRLLHQIEDERYRAECDEKRLAELERQSGC